MNTSQRRKSWKYEPTHADEMEMLLVNVLRDLNDFDKKANVDDRMRAGNMTLLSVARKLLKEIELKQMLIVNKHGSFKKINAR